MLSEVEKKHCKTLLEVLNDWDLQCLAHTITQNAVAVVSREEAVEAIIEYSASLDELLRRQKLKKEHLKDHLIKVGDKRLLSSVVKSDKESLIKLMKETINQWTIKKADVVAEKATETQTNEIASAFVSWFYSMINSQSNDKFNSNWGPAHFWEDAKLILHIEQPDGMIRDEIQNADDVCHRILNFVLSYKVIFNPNLTSNGVCSEMNCHGLLAVKSSGTLHRHSSVIGLYEQVFGLIKDPTADGNWKIKNTELKIRLNVTDQKAVCLAD